MSKHPPPFDEYLTRQQVRLLERQRRTALILIFVGLAGLGLMCAVLMSPALGVVAP